MIDTLERPTAPKALVLAGGWMHPPEEPVVAIERLLKSWSFGVTVVTEADAVAEAAVGCDLLVVSACWFAMAADRYSDEQRNDWAVGRNPIRERALLALADRGTPILALHPESAVLARSGSGNPLMWLREDGDRRAAVNLLGHDRGSLDEPGHRAAVEQLLIWLLRDEKRRS